MALTKAQIVESIQHNSGFPGNKSSEVMETLLEIIKSTLESGEDVLISNFGKFSVNHKEERRGRNPATGDAMMLASRKVLLPLNVLVSLGIRLTGIKKAFNPYGD